MDFKECIEGRRSIRRYKSSKLSHQDFEEIIRLTTFSPSWKNSQIPRFTLIEDDNLKKQIEENCLMGSEFNAKTISSAPNLIVMSMVENKSGFEKDGSFTTSKGDRWEMFDCGVAAGILCLSAYSKGYGTVIMGIFDEDCVKEVVGIPKDQKVAALIPIGLPDESPAFKERKTVGELITYK